MSITKACTGQIVTGLVMRVIANDYYVRTGLWFLIRERSANPGGRNRMWKIHTEEEKP